jgi:branched-chain amino acid transport system substrate-binding protein
MIRRRDVLTGAFATATMSTLRSPVARAQGPAKVGVIASTSGHLAAAGQAARRGAEIAALHLKGSGPAIELVFADTESRPENGRISAERLIREGCSVLVGAGDSGATISAAQVAEASKVPLVINFASASQITESGYTQIFRNFTKTDTLLTEAVKRIKEMTANSAAQPRTAVLMYVNDTFGQAASKSVNTFWSGAGVPIKIVDQIDYDARAKDLSVEVAKAKAHAPDMMLAVSRVNDGILIVREMVKQSFNPMALIFPGSPASYEKPFTDSLGKYGDDAINCVPWYDVKNPRTKDVLKLSEKTFPNTRFDLTSLFTFECVEIVAEALKRSGSAQAAAIREALKTTMIKDHIATGGPIQFDEKGQNNNIAVVMLQNRKQEPIVVGPAEFAAAEVRFPMTPFNKR